MLIFILSSSFLTIVPFLSFGHVSRRDGVKHGIILSVQNDEQITPARGLSIDVVALAATTPLKPRIIPNGFFDFFRLHLVIGQVCHVVFVPDDIFDVHSLHLPDS